jgi:PAS domain S-box-containing protein
VSGDEDDRRAVDIDLTGVADGAEMVVLVIDDDGALRYASPSVTSLLGHGTADLIGHDPLELIHPDDREHERRRLDALRRPGARAVTDVVRLASSNGTWHLAGAAADVAGDSDAPDGNDRGPIVIVMTDLSAETDLAASEARLEALAELLPVGIIEVDNHGRFRSWNRPFRDIMGVDATGSTGDVETWLARIHPEDRERASREWERLVSSSQPGEITYRYIRDDGAVVHLLARTTPTFLDDGSPSGYVCSVEEVDQLVEMAQAARDRADELTLANEQLLEVRAAARRTDRARNELLARVSHELCGPLEAIIEVAERLEADPDDPDARANAIATISGNGLYLLALVEEILDVARPASDEGGQPASHQRHGGAKA